MKWARIALLTISFCSLAKPDCLEFWRNWETCPQEQFPDMPREILLCFRELSFSSEVLISRETEKQSAVLCHNKTFPSNVFNCLPIKDTSLLLLTDCPFPPPKFHTIFGSNNSTLKTLEIRYDTHQLLNSFLDISAIPLLQTLIVNGVRSANTFNLVLTSLPFLTSVSVTDHNFTALVGRPFRSAPLLQVLIISGGKMEFLNDDTFHGINPLILDLSRNHLANFTPALLRNMHGLMKLNLSHNSIETVDLLLDNTPQLEIFTVDHNNIATLPPRLFSKTPNISVLLMNHNRLQSVPGTIFQNLYRLKLLSLENNRLTILPSNLFEDLISLLWLDLQFNQIHNISSDLFSPLQSLHVLDLSDNKLHGFSSPSVFGKSKFLSKVNLSGNQLEEFPGVHWSLNNISHLDLSRNLIRRLVLPVELKDDASVFLGDNLISVVEVDTSLEHKSLYYLEGNPFYCNCSLGDFIYFLPFLRVVDAEKLRCRNPWYRNHKYLTDFSKVRKLCEVKDDCPSGCRCEMSANNYVTLDCRNSNLTDIPVTFPSHTSVIRLDNNHLTSLSTNSWPEVTHLYVTNNSLISLHNWTVPPMLQFLAVDGNQLTDLPTDLMETVEDSPNFGIYMAHNQWRCDCGSVHLKKWLMRNLLKVRDSMHIYCSGSGGERAYLLVETRLDEFVCSKAFRSIRINVQCMYAAICAVLFLLPHFANKFL